MRNRLPLLEGSELRPLQKMDAKSLFDIILANQNHLKTWFDWAPQTKRIEDTQGFLEESLKKTRLNKAFDAGIWRHNKLCGVIGFHPIDWHHRFAEIGFWLAEKNQGQGLMTRAVQVMTLHAFREFSLNRVEIICAIDNVKSRAVAERVGFSYEGIHREGQILAGKPVDEAIYSLLVRDYLARPALLEQPHEPTKTMILEERVAC